METRKMISLSKHISTLALACGLVLIVCSALTSYAQDEDVDTRRGFYPGGSFAISDIETINTTNGNLILNVPIGALPAGRNGLTAKVSLTYNSKIWDANPEQAPNCIGQLVTQNYLSQGSGGGWQYGFQYERGILNRLNPISNQGENRVWMVFPDGSTHVLRPQGYTGPDNPTGYYSANYYNSTWYSTDGTYFRVTFGPDAGLNTPWTMYFSDGVRVTGGDGTHRIYDRNDNYIEFQNITWNNNPANKIVDQLGRYIIIERASSPFYDPTRVYDYIHMWESGGQQITWTIKWKVVQPRKFYRTTKQACDTAGLGDYLIVVDQIILPSQAGSLAYTFGYNVADYPPGASSETDGYGEVNSILLPTGAQVSYSYSIDGLNNLLWNSVLRNSVRRKSVTYQQEYDGSSTQVTENWIYGIGTSGSTVRGPDGAVLTEFFYAGGEFWKRGLVYKTMRPDGTVIERIWQTNAPFGASDVNPYVKTEFTSVRDAAGTLVKTAIKDFNYDKNGNVTRVTEYDWVDYGSVPRDASGNPTGIPVGIYTRDTINTYYSPTPDASNNTTDDPDVYFKGTSPNLRNAIASREVQSGLSGAAARTEFFYDNALTTGNLIEQKSWDSIKGAITRPLTTANSISVTHQYDSYGNRTWSTDANGVQTQFIYDPINGHENLYVTQTKVAVNTPVQQWTMESYDFHTGLVTQSSDMDNNVTTRTTYDVFERPTLVEEADGIAGVEKQTATEYSDTEKRVIVRSDLNTTGDGKLIAIQHYDQLGRICLTRRLESGDPAEATDKTKGVKIQTRYFTGDAGNQNGYELVSAPYRAATSGAAGGEPGMAWKRTKFDKGGKVIEVETFVGATPPAPWGGNSVSSGKFTTEYDAEFTTVTDQAGKKRRSRVDALGRLVRVDEPDALGNLGGTAAPFQPTDYAYNALDNLIQTTQTGVPNGGSTPVTQIRTFTFSSLGRLITANNPESGPISHVYDANGNLTRKTDARGIIINYTYDQLNRNRTVDYSNTAVNPDITRVYDNPALGAYGKGKFWHDYAGGDFSNGQNVEHKSVDSYDALGRPLSVRRQFKNNGVWSTAFTTSQTYDLAGHVKTKTYPSGRSVTYAYDVSGDLTNFTGNLGDGASRTYSTGIQYNPQGQLIREQFGTSTPLYHRRHYNSRGQLFDMRLGTDGSAVNDGPNPAQWTGASWNRGALRMFFSSNLIDYAWPAVAPQSNNGNLYRQDHFVPTALDAAGNVTGWVMSADYYCYDSLNRVAVAAEETYTSAGGYTPGVFEQRFGYDRFGNRLVSSAFGTGVPNPGFKINGANNRLIAPTDADGSQASDRMRYDASGNLIKDTHTQTGTSGNRTYDAENRMLTADGANGLANGYAYDADGHRTRRSINNGGEVWWQVFGIDGELVAEYQLVNGTPTLKKEYGYRNGQLLVIAETTGTCQWLVTDALGTPRMIADQTGSLGGIKRRDYLPFGEELLAGVGHRQPTNGYSLAQSPQPRQQFTSKERDSETGLDYFAARYYGSLYGRFTSPDEFTGGPDELYDFADAAADNPTFYADLTYPQSLNKYQYCYNNPLTTVDPDGHKGFKERLRDAVAAVADYGNGIVKGVVNSATYGTLDSVYGPKESDSIINRIGQGVGSAGYTVITTVGAVGVGVGGTAGTGGVGAVVTVPTAAFFGSQAISGAANLGKVLSTPIQSSSNSQQSGGGSQQGTSKTPAEMANDLSKQTGKNRAVANTPNKQVRIDLNGKPHFDKSTKTSIPTPHVHESKINRSPNGKVNLSNKTTRAATKEDIRLARKILENEQ
jgi:RHS repeat-associated protein